MGAAGSFQTLEQSEAWRDFEPQLRTQIQSVILNQQEHIQTVEGLLKGRIIDGLAKMRDQQLQHRTRDCHVTKEKKLNSASSQLVAIEAALSIRPADSAVAAISNFFHDSKDTDSDGRSRSIRCKLFGMP